MFKAMIKKKFIAYPQRLWISLCMAAGTAGRQPRRYAPGDALVKF
jgi:hypothetical protein